MSFLPKNLELRGKIKVNWIGIEEEFTIKFFNKRKGAFTKWDFRPPPPLRNTAAGRQEVEVTFQFLDTLLHAVL